MQSFLVRHQARLPPRLLFTQEGSSFMGMGAQSRFAIRRLRLVFPYSLKSSALPRHIFFQKAQQSIAVLFRLHIPSKEQM